MHNIKKNRCFISRCEEVGLQVYINTTEFMFVSYEQNVGRDSIKVANNKSFKSVAKFTYFGKILTYQNSHLWRN
jgi:hypothetical protein